MGKAWICIPQLLLLLLLLLHLFFSPGWSAPSEKSPTPKQTDSFLKFTISTPQKDITTPLTTPFQNPILNPNSNTDSESPAAMTPMSIPSSSSTSVGKSWCVASGNAAKTALQRALDYACGGGANCTAIQDGGDCYSPNTLRNHASYAFNDYYQKNPIPSSCNFGGTAVTTSTDPSVGSCRYPSTSTSASILNITSTNGARIFGGVPSNPSSSSQASTFRTFYLVLFMLLLTCIVI